jgi:hypothetical protein
VVGVVCLLSVGTGVTGLLGLYPQLDAGGLIDKGEAQALLAPFDDLIAGRDAELKRKFMPQVDLRAADQAFVDMRKAAGGGPEGKRRLVYAFWSEGSVGRSMFAIHEYIRDGQVVRVETQLRKEDELTGWRIANLHVRSAPENELKAQRQASLTIMPAPLVIAATFLVMTLSFSAAIAALLMKDVKRRWLWVVLAFVSAGAFRMDMLGAWTLQPIWIQLLGGGFTWSGSLFDPWVFTVSVPIGAIIFWANRIMAKPPPGPELTF